MSIKVETVCEQCRTCGAFSAVLHRVRIEEEFASYTVTHPDSLMALAGWELAMFGYTCPSCVAKQAATVDGGEGER